jgi:WD40 repeat protein
MDFITLLLKRHMDLIAQDIFSHLDLISLMNCELVCQNWNSAIKKGKLWKRLYCQECHKSSLLPTLFQRREAINQWEWEADRLVKSEETLLKNLFKTRQILKENWAVGNFQTTTTTLAGLNVSHLKMDANRIVFGVTKEFSRPFVNIWNRWTLECEGVIISPDSFIMTSISDLLLWKNLVFCSFEDGNIIVWDVKAGRECQSFNGEEVPSRESVVSLKIQMANGILISCFRTEPPYPDREIGHDWDSTVFSLRRISDDGQFFSNVVERIEHIPYTTVCQIESDSNFFAIFMESFEFSKIQLRSADRHFQFLHELDFTNQNLVHFSCHSGRLATVSTEEDVQKIKLWDPKTLKCKKTWPALVSTVQVLLSSNHLVTCSHDDEKNSLTVWEMPTETSEEFPSELFQLQSEGDSTAFAFDELQILVVSNWNELIRIPIPVINGLPDLLNRHLEYHQLTAILEVTHFFDPKKTEPL